MKKRLRKKKHIGEFSKWARQLVVTRNTKLEADAFHRAFILEAIESNDCYCTGSFSDDKINVIVELGRASDDIESKFARVTTWLSGRSEVEGFTTGPLFDIWYQVYDDIEE